MKRYLKRHGVALLLTLLVNCFFTTSCKKEDELKPEKVVEKVIPKEVVAWFKENQSLPKECLPLYQFTTGRN